MKIVNTSEITFRLPQDHEQYSEFLKHRDENVTWVVEKRDNVIKYKREQLLFSNDKD